MRIFEIKYKLKDDIKTEIIPATTNCQALKKLWEKMNRRDKLRFKLIKMNSKTLSI